MAETITCGNCQAEVQAGHRFCGTCGAPLAQADVETPPEAVSSADERPQDATFSAQLIRIHGGGGDGQSYPLDSTSQFVGREGADILFPDDRHISPRHAEFFEDNRRLFVRDNDSLNGVFVRITQPVVLEDGDVFMAGEQFIRVELSNPGGQAIDDDQTHFFGSPRPQSFLRLRQLLEGGRDGLCHLVDGHTVNIGREGTELEFPNDRFISGRHCAVERDENAAVLVDRDSRNGTYIRVDGTRELKHGDFIFIGRQLLRVELIGGGGGA